MKDVTLHLNLDPASWSDNSAVFGARARLMYIGNVIIGGQNFYAEAIRVHDVDNVQTADEDSYASRQFDAMYELDSPDTGFVTVKIGDGDYLINILPSGR